MLSKVCLKDWKHSYMFPMRLQKRAFIFMIRLIQSESLSFVVIALLPALLFGMYNVGYFNYTLSNTYNDASFFEVFFYGFLAVMPKLVVSYAVGLGIEFAWAQWKNEEIQEGFLVTGILVPLIVPVSCPLWTLAIATAFSVIIVKRYLEELE